MRKMSSILTDNSMNLNNNRESEHKYFVSLLIRNVSCGICYSNRGYSFSHMLHGIHVSIEDSLKQATFCGETAKRVFGREA